jgi:hypothetical protein
MIRRWLVSVFFLLSLIIVTVVVDVGVNGKEIVAQRDTWTLIGENDTVDAGMHIRIDMTTGEKWVKQITEEDHNVNDGNVDGTDVGTFGAKADSTDRTDLHRILTQESILFPPPLRLLHRILLPVPLYSW